MFVLRSFSLVLLAILLSGCASSRVPSEPPQTLDAVNRVLGDRWARIQLGDGTIIGGVESVRVAPDSTTYVDRRTQDVRRLATSYVRSVSVRTRKGGALQGALFGAVPGLALSGAGIVIASGDPSLGEYFSGLIYVYGGILLTLVGVAKGAAKGKEMSSVKWVQVYRSPVDSY